MHHELKSRTTVEGAGAGDGEAGVCILQLVAACGSRGLPLAAWHARPDQLQACIPSASIVSCMTAVGAGGNIKRGRYRGMLNFRMR